jgi:hypothetical protein
MVPGFKAMQFGDSLPFPKITFETKGYGKEDTSRIW